MRMAVGMANSAVKQVVEFLVLYFKGQGQSVEISLYCYNSKSLDLIP